MKVRARKYYFRARKIILPLSFVTIFNLSMDFVKVFLYDYDMRSWAKSILIFLGIISVTSLSAYAENNAPAQVVFADYMQGIKDKIQSNWNQPELMDEGHAVIQFKVTREGELYAYDLKESSGNPVFDEFAVNALQKSAPFGDFPEDSKQNYITVQYSFDSKPVTTARMKKIVMDSEKFINVDNDMARRLIDEAIREADGDSVAYFLYARRYKIDRLLCDVDAAQKDLAECKRLKDIYDKNRIQTCTRALEEEETPFAHFALANAYDLAGDYEKAKEEIDKAIGMTELNNAYKRYRMEICTRRKY